MCKGSSEFPWGYSMGPCCQEQASSVLPGLTRYRAGRAPQGASELGRGVQATAGETRTHGCAGGGGGHLGALSGLETDAIQGSDPGNPICPGVGCHSEPGTHW